MIFIKMGGSSTQGFQYKLSSKVDKERMYVCYPKPGAHLTPKKAIGMLGVAKR
jgi:hypothetical protein